MYAIPIFVTEVFKKNPCVEPSNGVYLVLKQYYYITTAQRHANKRPIELDIAEEIQLPGWCKDELENPFCSICILSLQWFTKNVWQQSSNINNLHFPWDWRVKCFDTIDHICISHFSCDAGKILFSKKTSITKFWKIAWGCTAGRWHSWYLNQRVQFFIYCFLY